MQTGLKLLAIIAEDVEGEAAAGRQQDPRHLQVRGRQRPPAGEAPGRCCRTWPDPGGQVISETVGLSPRER